MRRPYRNWATTGGCPYTDRFESTEGVSPYAPTSDRTGEIASLQEGVQATFGKVASPLYATGAPTVSTSKPRSSIICQASAAGMPGVVR